MSHFSRVRWRQTCLKMNPFSYIWDLEDGENSGSWLRGLGSLSKWKRVPNVQGTSQQENGAWENGHDCFKNIPDDLLWGHVWFQHVHWSSIYPLCSQHKDTQTQSRVLLVSSQNLFWDTDQASFNDWENTPCPSHTHTVQISEVILAVCHLLSPWVYFISSRGLHIWVSFRSESLVQIWNFCS